MSVMRATVTTLAMLLTMIAVVTGINANSNDAGGTMAADGYGISSHIAKH